LDPPHPENQDIHPAFADPFQANPVLLMIFSDSGNATESLIWI
jgi:hypothetical protein